nr:hypothetical protein [Tanacetum cinerariifolium]
MVDKRGEGKITTWEELVGKFFCKFYPESYDEEEEMLDEGNNWGIDPLDFLSRLNSLFEYDRKVDGRTKKLDNMILTSLERGCNNGNVPALKQLALKDEHGFVIHLGSRLH